MYFATTEGTTYALDAKTGKLLWPFSDGKYTPVIAHGEQIYYIGRGRIYAMQPTSLGKY